MFQTCSKNEQTNPPNKILIASFTPAPLVSPRDLKAEICRNRNLLDLKAQVLNFEWWMKGFVWGRLRSTDVRKVFGAFLGLILVLEAETLSGSKYFHAASVHIGFGSWFCWNYGFLSPGRVEVGRYVAEKTDLRNLWYSNFESLWAL